MKPFSCTFVFNTITDISGISCHRTIISRSKFLPYKTNYSRLQSYRYCGRYAKSVPDNVINRPEVQEFLKLMSDAFDKVDPQEYRTPIISIYKEMKKLKDDLKNLRTLNLENDKDLQELIEVEEQNLKNEIKRLNNEIIMCALPKDDDSNAVVFSVIPGLGGQEAKLFSEELFEMYLNYARYRNWKISCIEKLTAEGGGISKAEVNISGESVFKSLRHEAGIHRVQRVPITEKNSKMQTSTCKIYVTPDFACDEIILNNNDLKFETKTSSGAGGQNVNKLETCVRVTHIPTGLRVVCQTERFQSVNKLLAIDKLKRLLYQEQQDKIDAKIKDIKSDQAVTVKRADKIRTYNFMQNRVTDHRINYTTHNIGKYMEGNSLLHDMVSQLHAHYREEYIIKNLNKIVQMKTFDQFFRKREKNQ